MWPDNFANFCPNIFADLWPLTKLLWSFIGSHTDLHLLRLCMAKHCSQNYSAGLYSQKFAKLAPQVLPVYQILFKKKKKKLHHQRNFVGVTTRVFSCVPGHYITLMVPTTHPDRFCTTLFSFIFRLFTKLLRVTVSTYKLWGSHFIIFLPTFVCKKFY